MFGFGFDVYQINLLLIVYDYLQINFGYFIEQNNTSTIQLEQNGKQSSAKQTLHINIRYFYVTDKINNGEVREVSLQQIDFLLYMELKFEVQQIQSRADVNSTSVIKWDLETSFYRFKKCFCVLVLMRFHIQMMSKSYHSCVVMNLDRCYKWWANHFHLHSRLVQSASASASASAFTFS